MSDLRNQFEKETGRDINLTYGVSQGSQYKSEYIHWLENKIEQSPERVSVDAIVIGSLPDDDSIEEKALDYIEDGIYVSTGNGHDTCREWAFISGAKWMRDLISSDQ